MTKSTRIGIDTGGTFTDFIWLDTSGRLQIHKRLSNPADPAQVIFDGIQDSGLPPTADVVHGSTVATNALLERRGCRTALITTNGFADVLAIGRQNRPDLYALVPQKPHPLVPSAWRFGLRERVNSRGEVITVIDPDDVADLAQKLVAADIESVAICLLFSFLHPPHEEQVAAALNQHFADKPIHISLSSEILPEYREYERTAATVINAYVAPLMSRYLSRLATLLAPRHLAIMQSNGGLLTADTAGKFAVRTVLSGPAGGIVGAQFVAGAAGMEGRGFDQIITFDMGGTSTDVALCPGKTPVTTDGEIAGLPLRIPFIDIHTVGAGGGSLAYIDAGGALLVGPQSAGASPGPACYRTDYSIWRRELDEHFAPGRATVSDANLVLGRLDSNHFLGGEMKLHHNAAQQALSDLARQMGAISAEQAAWDVVRVANANMERAIRRISVERGHDPRRFTLVAFGGGGPLHACELAEQLQIPRVLIPSVPGILSALGMLAAAPSRDYSQTIMLACPSPGVMTRLASYSQRLRKQAIRDMVNEGYSTDGLLFQTGLDMRYTGQSHELTVWYQNEQTESDILNAFHSEHEGRFGYARSEAAVEIVTIRLTVLAPVDPVVLPHTTPGQSETIAPPIGRKPVWFINGFHDTPYYLRNNLEPGHQFTGPAIIFQYDTTSVIPPGWQVSVDSFGNMLADHR